MDVLLGGVGEGGRGGGGRNEMEAVEEKEEMRRKVRMNI